MHYGGLSSFDLDQVQCSSPYFFLTLFHSVSSVGCFLHSPQKNKKTEFHSPFPGRQRGPGPEVSPLRC